MDPPTGNIYYPVVRAPPYPAVLTPHGHWNYGRLQNGEDGSIPGRCIDFARQGYVVFSIDMVGYNDSFQLPHDGAKSRAQLKADTPLLNPGPTFDVSWYREQVARVGASSRLAVHDALALSDPGILGTLFRK